MKSEFISLKNYLKLLDQFPDSISFYHGQQWLQAVANGFGIKLLGVLTFDKNSKVIALTPVMSMKKGPFRLFGSPLSGFYTQYLGPIFQENLTDQERSSVLISQHRLLSKQGHYIEWGELGKQKGWNNYWDKITSLGYDYIARQTLVLDLSQGEEKIWSNFQGRARNMIRKSEKSGVKALIIEPTSEWISAYYSMLQETFSSQGRAVPHPLSFFLQMMNLTKEGKALFIAAEFEGRMIAGAIFLCANERMLYFSGTSNKEGMKYAANSLIQWKAIQTAILNGNGLYDMGGLGVPSIDKFKLSFGGKEIKHHRWVYKSWLFRLIEPIAIWALKKGFVQLSNNNTSIN